MRDLEARREVRRFGSGWFSGFFALLLAISGLLMVVALRFPDWFATPELAVVKEWSGFRAAIHIILLSSYALSLLSLLLRPRKALGFFALMIGLSAALMGGSSVQPEETASWGIFFGLDFFVVNLLATGFMFAPARTAEAPQARTAIVPLRMARRPVLFSHQLDVCAVARVSCARPVHDDQRQHQQLGRLSSGAWRACPGSCNS